MSTSYNQAYEISTGDTYKSFLSWKSRVLAIGRCTVSYSDKLAKIFIWIERHIE